MTAENNPGREPKFAKFGTRHLRMHGARYGERLFHRGCLDGGPGLLRVRRRDSALDWFKMIQESDPGQEGVFTPEVAKEL